MKVPITIFMTNRLMVQNKPIFCNYLALIEFYKTDINQITDTNNYKRMSHNRNVCLMALFIEIGI